MLFIVEYHKRSDKEYNTHARREHDAASMCAWIHRKLKDKVIDWYRITQYNSQDETINHDVTDVYRTIIESGLSVLEVKSVKGVCKNG